MKTVLAALAVLGLAGCATQGQSVPRPDPPSVASPAREACQRPARWEWEPEKERWVCKLPRRAAYFGGLPVGAVLVGHTTIMVPPPPLTPPDAQGRYQSPPSHMLAPQYLTVPVYATPVAFACLHPFCRPHPLAGHGGFTFIWFSNRR